MEQPFSIASEDEHDFPGFKSCIVFCHQTCYERSYVFVWITRIKKCSSATSLTALSRRPFSPPSYNLHVSLIMQQDPASPELNTLCYSQYSIVNAPAHHYVMTVQTWTPTVSVPKHFCANSIFISPATCRTVVEVWRTATKKHVTKSRSASMRRKWCTGCGRVTWVGAWSCFLLLFPRQRLKPLIGNNSRTECNQQSTTASTFPKLRDECRDQV